MIEKTLGHYRVGEQLGRGGMGEVYLADDLSLNRKVALKFLPGAFATDPERMARFEREAKLLASLNHSSIAAIYGLEQAEGKRFLVLELVEGETLAQRISKGALPVEEALGICRQIAEGLEVAHEKGVIHRDLKPANVMITEGDKVKILDFGLAKALSDETLSFDSSQSPTLTEAMTRPGVILGTAAYMSPEQAKGKAVDKRADIWAFGCVLYECLTGKRPFDGETVTETLAAILKEEPDWNALSSAIPPNVHFVLHRCLEKDMGRRFRDAADLRILMDAAINDPPQSESTLRSHHHWRHTIALGLGALIIAFGAGVAGWLMKTSELSRPVARVDVNLPVGGKLAIERSSIALSPDGSQLAYVAIRGDNAHLYIKPIDSLEANPIPNTEGAQTPFFSPDGKWIGFSADGKLKKVSVAGGSVQVLCTAPFVEGASWASDDTIYFSPFSISGIWKISASGGTPQEVTRLDRSKGEVSHRWPQILPGGKVLLFTIWTGPGWEEKHAALQFLQDGNRRILLNGADTARYVSSGHLIYVYDRHMMVVPFDLTDFRVTGGAAVTLVEEVNSSTEGAEYAVSENGILAYMSPLYKAEGTRLVWVDRKGKTEPLEAPLRNYQSVRLSPDGHLIATAIGGPTIGVWCFDPARLTLTRLTSEEGSSQRPIWTPDGRYIVYRGTRKGFRNLYWRSADGSGIEERLTIGESNECPFSFSPDGKYLAYEIHTQGTGMDLWVLPMDGDRKPKSLLTTFFSETCGMISPDGRWLAYQSNESGRPEIYVTPFPGPGGRWQISTEGGTEPLWNRNSRELLYRNGNKMMCAAVKPQATFSAESPRQLFEARYVTGALSYDVSPDGLRFLMIKGDDEEQNLAQIHIVMNWFEELKRLIPTGKK